WLAGGRGAAAVNAQPQIANRDPPQGTETSIPARPLPSEGFFAVRTAPVIAEAPRQSPTPRTLLSSFPHATERRLTKPQPCAGRTKRPIRRSKCQVKEGRQITIRSYRHGRRTWTIRPRRQRSSIGTKRAWWTTTLGEKVSSPRSCRLKAPYKWS